MVDGKAYCKENFSDAYEEAKRGIKKVRLIWFLIYAASLVFGIVFFVNGPYESVAMTICGYLNMYFFVFALLFLFARLRIVVAEGIY